MPNCLFSLCSLTPLMKEPGGLDLISRQSFLSCETKFLARLWKELVFAAAEISVDLSPPLFQGNGLLPYLIGVIGGRRETEIGFQIVDRLRKTFELEIEQAAVPDLLSRSRIENHHALGTKAGSIFS